MASRPNPSDSIPQSSLSHNSNMSPPLDSSHFPSVLTNLAGPQPHFLPPKPWDSTATEGGRFSSPLYQQSCIQDSPTLSESGLVRLVINALQGLKSALYAIHNLCEAFSSDPADRTFHRIPSLWHRSSSSSAFGKILSSLSRSGLAFFFLRKFVDYYLGAEEKSPDFAQRSANTHKGDNEKGEYPRHGLINQAFAIAVEKVIQGYISALNTLSSSIQLRHSSKDANSQQNGNPGVGCLTSVVHTEMSVLEVYLHTKELRTHIQALANICFFKNEDLGILLMSLTDALETDLTSSLCSFPRGADLLTYLYAQLQDADPVHHMLLEFLFVCSCEPYYGFIKSWIYQAQFCDPYKEFIIVYEDATLPCLQGKAGYPGNLSLASVKEQDGVAVPCFLKDVRLPLLRAGQQLQVLVQLLNMCSVSSITDNVNSTESDLSSDLSNLEDILPYWNDSSTDPASCLFPLTFDKRSMEAMVLKREVVYKRAQEKLLTLLPRLSIRCQHLSSTVIPYCMVPLKALVSNEEFLYSLSIADKQTTNLATDEVDTDASSISGDFSSDTEQPASSSCPSLNAFHGKVKSYGSNEMPDIFLEAHPKLVSGFYDNQSISERPLGTEGHCMEFATERSADRILSADGFIDHCHRDTERTQFYDLSQFQASKLCRKSEISSENYLFSTCWPLGSLLQNPFSFDGGHTDDENVLVPNSSLKMIYGKKILAREDSHFPPVVGCDDSEIDLFTEGDECRKNNCGRLTEAQDLCCDSKILSRKSLLAKKFHKRCNLLDGNLVASEKSSFTCFDFSSVEDPCKVYKERFNAISDHGIQVAIPLSVVPGSCSLEKACKNHGMQCHDGDSKPSGQIDQSVLSSPAFSAENLIEGKQEKDLSSSNSGGANWESLLSYSNDTVVVGSGGCGYRALAQCEIPLDVVINKCFVQEILLQYKYISNFTIRLLEEGFDLRGHLLALRRYHFMELADWADSFIMSLWYYKWHVADVDQRVSEVHALLDLALQRSSCESDQYKERLFISIKGQGMVLPSTSASGVHSFDFITLGYKVDWPVSIVLTPEALKLYSEIFSFLTQVKLAVFSLTDTWRSFKDLLSHCSGSCGQENFIVLIKMRQQVSHFVLTLQQYVQSQLSHVSWCKLLHSLKHQVKDMLDLESVHMAYLANSLHICFLSVETQPVASIIQRILQCALDFRSCFSGGGLKELSGTEDKLQLNSFVNFSQVLAIKATFEKNLKELYLCYLKSPKHSDFGLCCFWEYLNYNGYYSNVISQEIGWGRH